MGKKPLVAIVGLVWAGMALVGCENCKNCRNKFTPTPTYQSKPGAPVVPDAMIPSPVTPTAGAPNKADVAKTVDTPGMTGFSPTTPAVTTPTSVGATPGSPTIQSSLRPGTDTPPVGLPGRSPSYRSGETPVSRSGTAEGIQRMPPLPVIPVGGTTAGGSTESLPPITLPSMLPPPSLAPSIPTAPMPGTTGNNSLPGIDPLSK